MDALLDTPGLGTYALCTSILAIKLFLSSVYTGVQRQRSHSYANPEDAASFGQEGDRAGDGEVPAVAHALRIQRNDAENLPAFFAVGLVYVLTGASATGVAIYMWTFTIARIVHTIAYAAHLQPWRALAYLTAALCVVGMSVSTILRVL
jgi:uncharacterized MAPEG superfamily protein